MRLLVVGLGLGLAALPLTSGLRLGYVTLTPTSMFNATGENRYTLRAYDPDQAVGVRGSCKVSSGRATFRPTDPKGTQSAVQVCPQGQWGLNVLGAGDGGNYTLTTDLEKFSGTIDIEEARK
ncbi:hypothetical protein [Deinococcus frigens]|uniref:hypothetical protein n=1 Tax=Deinococcus frigens TaxID=249403 RepID=UPI000497B927|nr:hypothetical protein [Deinococcus frigens]